MEWLWTWETSVSRRLRATGVFIRNHLITRYQKTWRTMNPVILNDVDLWTWTRACCRILQSDGAHVVSIGVHDRDIAAVDAVVHNSVLAIRIRLRSGCMLNRAEPLPISMREHTVVASWDREEIRIELQASAAV